MEDLIKSMDSQKVPAPVQHRLLARLTAQRGGDEQVGLPVRICSKLKNGPVAEQVSGFSLLR